MLTVAARPDASTISRTPGVCGGSACIRDTRIPVWLLVRLKQLGRPEVDLLGDYPGLTAADLDAAWAYYRQRTAEVEGDIADQERDDEAELEPNDPVGVG